MIRRHPIIDIHHHAFPPEAPVHPWDIHTDREIMLKQGITHVILSSPLPVYSENVRETKILPHAGGSVPFLAHRVAVSGEWNAITQSEEQIYTALRSISLHFKLFTKQPRQTSLIRMYSLFADSEICRGVP